MVTIIGVLALLFSLIRLPYHSLDLRFLILVLLTLVFSSRLSIRIPRSGGTVSVSDTFIFLALFLFGAEVAVVLAAADSLVASRRFIVKLRAAFNASVSACSIFVAGWFLRLLFQDDVIAASRGYSSAFVTAICVVALTQFILNSSLTATAVSLSSGQPIWQTWRQKFLWASLTYFAGASAAGVIAKLTNVLGTVAFLSTLPIILIIYFTYQTYLKNVEESATQAEQAERHVEELSHYIAEQERIREQFAQMEKMSALGQLATGVAHNFNNALASIIGRAQLTLRNATDPGSKRNLELLLRSAVDAANTVKRIQDFARRGPNETLEVVGVTQLLLDVSEITRPRWKDSAEAHEINITLELNSEQDAYVMGNASELREVLINMIFNAVDAMPEGGRLRLASELVNSSVIISVGDTGQGMTSEARSRVFEPFFTTKGEMGMGLGLSVSYGIISRHGGTIKVESKMHVGSTFRIELPIAEYIEGNEADQAGKLETKSEKSLIITSTNDQMISQLQNIGAEIIDTAQHPVEATQYMSSSTRVLIVDDEPQVLTTYRDILLSLGYNVSIAASGKDAIEIAKDFCPDIFLADNNMPVMSGLQTIQELRSIAPDVLSILTTGYSDIGIVTKALRQSVFDFLLKPVSLENLTHSIQRAVMHLEARERERRQKDFLSIVSHELRAPLQAPLRYLENILTSDSDQLTEKQRSMLQRAAKGIKSEVRLINNLLDLQYLESGRFNVKSLNSSLTSAIKEVVESFHIQAADNGVQISWNPPLNPVLVQFDPEQIRQAIGNVLNNAIQHTPVNGTVTVRLFSCRAKVRLIIRDEGLGIAGPYLERVFEKSFQVPVPGGKKGLGIGLYIAREIVRAHGGEIQAKSKLEQGSIFIITLPNASTG
jgi:signal transduction histidine kinase